jgi:hypothetical protein
MDVGSPTLLEHSPFPRNSVNLVVGPTNIGKTHFVNQLLTHYQRFFVGPIRRILVVLCNDRVPPSEQLFQIEDLSVEQISLAEFVPDNLQEDDLVVIDDLQTVTEPIKLTISVCAHHYNLVALFVITHGLLGGDTFVLLNLCHRLFMFMSASSNIRQLSYIINNFYHDPEIKKYLKSVLGFCQSEKEVLALEFNPVGKQKNETTVLAFSHLARLIDRGYFFLYPHPHWGREYASQSLATVKMDNFDGSRENWPEPILIAVPVANVQVKSPPAAAAAAGPKRACMEKTQWEETIGEIEENIESYFPPVRWQRVKNLAKEILRNPQFCVKTDGKTFHLKERPRTEVPMIDFLAVATRRAGPMEQSERDPTWKLFKLHVDTLLKNNAPKDLFKNKLLMAKRFQ